MNPFINQNANSADSKPNKSNIQFTVGAKQSKFIFNTSMIAGVAFLVVLGLGYLFKYLIVDLQNEGVIKNLPFVMIGSLIACFIISLVYNFSKKRNIGLLIFMYVAFILLFSFSVSAIFMYFKMNELFLIFGLTGGTLLITGIIGFLMTDKVAMSMMKIYMILFTIYAISFIAFFFIMMFGSFGTFTWYSYFIIAIVGLLILFSNCFEFYKLKKINNFINMSDLPPIEIRRLTLETSLTLLMSIIQTLMIVAQTFALSNR